MSTFVGAIEIFSPGSEKETAFQTLFAEYERVIVHSLISSFCLDFIINDQYGGDVDTIHNVRKIGHDKDMHYKDSTHELSYQNRGEYNYVAYHTDNRFTSKKARARCKIRDEMTPDSDFD